MLKEEVKCEWWTTAHARSRVPCCSTVNESISRGYDQSVDSSEVASDHLIKYIVCINMRVFFVASTVLVDFHGAQRAPLAISSPQSNEPQKELAPRRHSRHRGQRPQQRLKCTKMSKMGRGLCQNPMCARPSSLSTCGSPNYIFQSLATIRGFLAR